MSSYDDLYWSEVVTDDSPLEREREDAALREWEDENRREREITLQDPATLGKKASRV